MHRMSDLRVTCRVYCLGPLQRESQGSERSDTLRTYSRVWHGYDGPLVSPRLRFFLLTGPPVLFFHFSKFISIFTLKNSLYEHIYYIFFNENNFKFMEKLQRVQRVPIHTQFPVNILHQQDTFVKTNEPILICYSKLKSILYLDFSQFLPKLSFFCSKIAFRLPIIFSHPFYFQVTFPLKLLLYIYCIKVRNSSTS